MVRHVVMWNFKPEITAAEKAQRKADMKKNLESLVGKVPGLLNVTYVDQPIDSSTHEMALVTEHDKAEAIAVYASHPDHVHVADTYVRPFVHQRCALDYEV